MLKNTRRWKKRAAIAVTPSRWHNILHVLWTAGHTHTLAAGLCLLKYPERADSSVTLVWQAQHRAHAHAHRHASGHRLHQCQHELGRVTQVCFCICTPHGWLYQYGLMCMHMCNPLCAVMTEGWEIYEFFPSTSSEITWHEMRRHRFLKLNSDLKLKLFKFEDNGTQMIQWNHLGANQYVRYCILWYFSRLTEK